MLIPLLAKRSRGQPLRPFTIGMQIKLKDVAAQSQAPISAVSLILNNKPHTYSEKTAERVRRVAGELGYRPRAYAQSMRSGRYNQIVILMGKHKSTLQEHLRLSIDETATEHALRVGIAGAADEQFQGEAKMSAYLTQWASDGFILNFNHSMPQGLLDHLRRYRIPNVLVNQKQAEDAVYPRDQRAARAITERLIAQGHRKIAYLDDADPARHYSVAARREGYRLAMEAAGLPPLTRSLAPPWRKTYEEAEAELRDLLDEPARPTAFIAYEPTDAHLLQINFLRRGLVAPRDYSVVTFAESFSNNGGVPCDFMRTPFREMGKAAVEMLLAKIQDPGPARPSVALEHEYTDQGSVGPPPA